MRFLPSVRILTISLLALATTLACAQFNEAEAVLRARTYISAFAPELLDVDAVVLRDEMEVGGATTVYFHVQFRESVVWLASDGVLMGFANMDSAAAKPRTGADLYQTDALAWAALERVLGGAELPSGLARSKLEREERDGQHYCLRLTMRPSPHGYADSSGNYMVAEVHRVTGRLLALSIARGWSYETPNVRVSESQALTRAVETFGGTQSEWRVQLKYASMAYDRAPGYFKPMVSQRIMRLMYYVSSQRGTLMVDSVTGTTLDTWTIDASGSGTRRAFAHPGSSAGPARPAESGAAVGLVADSKSDSRTGVGVATATLVLLTAVTIVLRCARPRRRPI